MADDIVIRRPGALGVHSLLQFAFSVPALADAERFFTAFGLDVRRADDRLELYAFGNPHRWGLIREGSPRKRFEYLTFGAYAEDMALLEQRLRMLRIEQVAPHPAGDAAGLWIRDPDGIHLQIVAAGKVSPATKSPHVPRPGLHLGAAPTRANLAPARPRHLSHLLMFSTDVPRSIAFYRDVLGLRLSDHSGEIIAFMHGPHGSDHHLVAFAKSNGPGLHHTSWDVGSVDDVGIGMQQMMDAGYERGWGVGRHVLGSNYFRYVQDPWGTFAEYSFDIDYIPADLDWPTADHPPQDSLYVWGPHVPEDFVFNAEIGASAAAA